MRGGKRKGAGRPTLGAKAKRRVTITIEPDLLIALDAIGGSRSEHIRKAVAMYLQNMGGG